MIDDLHSDAPGLWLGERTGGVTIQRGPGFFVDLGFEGGLERAVGVVGTEEVGVADEETFFVVVSVDEPASAFWTVTTDFRLDIGSHYASAGIPDWVVVRYQQEG